MAENAAVAASNTQNARAADAAVALDDVVVAFRLADGGVYTAVERATLHVADGEFVAIVGPTGCGKSTLLNVTAGLFAPAAGAGRDFRQSALCAQPPGRLSVSGRRAVSLEDRAGECRHRPGDGRHAGDGGARPRAENGWRASASAHSRTAIRTCCRAASGSALAWRRC